MKLIIMPNAVSAILCINAAGMMVNCVCVCVAPGGGGGVTRGLGPGLNMTFSFW
jgi:hypothetical protein